MATVLMKKSVNLPMAFTSSRKTNRLTRSIKQKHAAVFCKKDTVLTETGVISFTQRCQLLVIKLAQMTSILFRLSFWLEDSQDFSRY
jgi:hypothetical protein